MSRVRVQSLVQVREDDMAAYMDQRAAEVDLIIAEPFKSGVIENLIALQGHARRMEAALQELDRGTPPLGGDGSDDAVQPLEARRP